MPVSLDTPSDDEEVPQRPARMFRFVPGPRSARSHGAWARTRPVSLASIAIMGIIGGQLLLLREGLGAIALGLYVLGALAVILLAWPTLRSVTRASLASVLVRADTTSPPLWIATAGIVSAGIAFGRAWFRNSDQSATDIVVFWLLGLLLTTIAGSWGNWISPQDMPRAMRRTWNALRWDREFAIIATAIVLIALLARVVMLDRFPTIVVSDEGILLGEAQSFRIQMPMNPFTLDHYAMPNLYMALEGQVSRAFASSLGSLRLASALLGTLSVLATLLLGRRLFGAWIGLAGAGILAMMPLHLWASRNALNNGSDAVALAFALFFLDRAIAGRHRWDALLCGIIFGLGIYGYTGARIFPIVCGLIACVTVVLPIYGRRLPIWELVRLGFWIIAGFLACAAPMLGFWAARPEMFFARIRTTGAVGGAVSLSDRLAVIPDVLLYPFFDRHSGPYYQHGGIFFRHDPPFLGWLVVPFVAIGFVCWGVWAIRGLVHRESRLEPGSPRPELLLISWMVISAAIAQTESMESQRFLSLTIVWALAAGTGLVVAISALGPLLRWSSHWQAFGLMIALVGIGAWHASFYFSEERQISMYGESGATAVWDIAWRTQQLDHLPRIILAGSPTMSYEGYGQWIYMVPGLAGLVTDVPSFGNDATRAPVVAPGELVMVGGRRDPAEPCAVQTRNPTAMKGEARDRYGTLLYTVFTTGPTLMLPTAESPGESTLIPVTSDLCAQG